MTRGEKAKALFEEGYNCSQSVFLAFEDVIGLDRSTAVRISAGFGGGFARMREVCGAVSGMTAVISYVNACEDPNNHEKKKELYALIQKAIGEFKNINGHYICRELLGLNADSSPVPTKRSESFYHKRPCGELCKIAADIAEKYI